MLFSHKLKFRRIRNIVSWCRGNLIDKVCRELVRCGSGPGQHFPRACFSSTVGQRRSGILLIRSARILTMSRGSTYSIRISRSSIGNEDIEGMIRSTSVNGLTTVTLLSFYRALNLPRSLCLCVVEKAQRKCFCSRFLCVLLNNNTTVL